MALHGADHCPASARSPWPVVVPAARMALLTPGPPAAWRHQHAGAQTCQWGAVCILGGNNIMSRVCANMELRSICINKLLLKCVLRGKGPTPFWSHEAG